MKINNSSNVNQVRRNEQPAELQTGEMYKATVKERLSNNEAIVQIKGKNVQVKFEGSAPKKGDDVNIQITDTKGNVPSVKTLTEQNSSGKNTDNPDAVNVLRSFGTTPTPELKQAVGMLLDKGVPIDQETIDSLKAFFDKAGGSLADKLATIQAIINKAAPLTAFTLQSVHEALHGDSISTLFQQVLSAQSGVDAQSAAQLTSQGTSVRQQAVAELIRQFQAVLRQGASVQSVVQMMVEQLMKIQQDMPQLAGQWQQAAEQANQLQQAGRETEARSALQQFLDRAAALPSTPRQASAEQAGLNDLRAIAKNIKESPQLAKALQQLREHLTANSSLGREEAAKLNKALTEADSFQQAGKPGIARSIVSKALEGAIDQLAKKAPASHIQTDQDTDRRVDTAADEYVQNDELQAFQLSTKDLLVTEITRRLGEATEQFKTVKREIVRNLDNLIRSIPQNRSNVAQQVKPLLEATIDLLDKTILKSDITMLTDMDTEKTLMKASGQLSEARKLLNSGDNQKATELVNEIKRNLDQLNWKPSNTRIQHFLSKESIFLNESSSLPHKLSAQFEQMAGTFTRSEASARTTFEFMRSLGLNHESEVAQALVLHRDELAADDLQKNVKATMLQMMKNQAETSNQRIGDQPIDKAFMNLTGQQILSKADSGTSMQSLFFNLPVMLGSKPEDVKVYINGRKEGEKIDWENCSFYFLLDTKKLGETGIMLTAVSRNLSISIRNDRPDFKAKMQPMVERCKEHLREIGYNISSVQFEKLHRESGSSPVEQKEKAEPSPNRMVTGTKGYDFKI